MQIDQSTHIVMVIFVILTAVVPILAVKNRHYIVSIDFFAKYFGIIIGLIWIIYNIYYFLPGIFDWSISLPLHVCDILGPVAAIALIFRNRPACSTLSLSALPFAIQAIVTPTGDQDPEIFRFWVYWLLHAGIISAFFFNHFILKFRPVLGDLWRMYIISAIYIIVISAVNLQFDWNYGYIGNDKPSTPTAIDLLGPWPQRVILILLIAIIMQTIMFFVVRRKNNDFSNVSN